MNQFWDKDIPYIKLFGLHHMIYVAGVLILLFLLIRYRKYVRDHADRVGKIILIFSALQLVGSYSWYFLETGFDVSEALPLHISRISAILGFVFLLTRRLRIMDTLFFFGLFAYGTFALPLRIYPPYHLMGWSYFLNHAITILLPIYAAIAYDWRPSMKALVSAYKYFLVYFVFIYFFNPLVDGNYFYLKYRPFLKTIPEPAYVAVCVIGTFVVFLLGYGIAKLLHRLLTPNMAFEKEPSRL